MLFDLFFEYLPLLHYSFTSEPFQRLSVIQPMIPRDPYPGIHHNLLEQLSQLGPREYGLSCKPASGSTNNEGFARGATVQPQPILVGNLHQLIHIFHSSKDCTRPPARVFPDPDYTSVDGLISKAREPTCSTSYGSGNQSLVASRIPTQDAITVPSTAVVPCAALPPLPSAVIAPPGDARSQYENPLGNQCRNEGLPGCNDNIIMDGVNSSYPSSGQRDGSGNWKGSFEWDAYVDEINNRVFGNRDFRPQQREAINAALSGRDVFVTMPTGGGKSLVFQLPAVFDNETGGKVTVVVMPLVSLISDQEEQMRELGINVTTLKGGGPRDQQQHNDSLAQEDSFSMVAAAEVSLVFITPEKLAESTRVINMLKRLRANGKLSRFIIDEAHCVSQWGHDFRSSYLKLMEHEAVGQVPITALTATATAGIAQDVQTQLRMTQTVFIKGGINRANLQYEVRKKSRSRVLNDIQQIINNMDVAVHGKASGIIYCGTKAECEHVADGLRKLGINAAFYHASMDSDERTDVQRRWMGDKLQVIVATIAFGMGINKPDVRFVIHFGMSKTMEGYYQESGRAGRDGYPSLVVLFYDYQDKVRQDVMIWSNVTSNNQAAREQAEKKIDSLLSMVEYCENRSVCRRKLIAKHFNVLDVPTCREDEGQEPCDICSADSTQIWQLTDQTAAARVVLDAVRAAQGGGKKQLGLNTLKDICIGSKSKSLSAYPHLSAFSGCLRAAKICSGQLTGDLALTFLRRMVTQRWLHEQCERMEQGNTVGYLRPGRNTSGQFMAYVLQSKRSLDPQARKRRRLTDANPPGGPPPVDWSTPSTINRQISVGLEMKLKEALRALRQTLMDEHNLAKAHSVFNENTIIGCIQLLPRNVRELEGIPGLGAQRMKKYGDRIVRQVAAVLADPMAPISTGSVPSTAALCPIDMTEEYAILNSMDEETLREFAFDGG